MAQTILHRAAAANGARLIAHLLARFDCCRLSELSNTATISVSPSLQMTIKRARRAFSCWMTLNIFAVHAALRGDDNDRQVRIYQGQGAVLELTGKCSFTMYQSYLLDLQMTPVSISALEI